jgi:hypothetical protein
MVNLNLNKKEAKELFWLLTTQVQLGDTKYVTTLDKLSMLKFKV